MIIGQNTDVLKLINLKRQSHERYNSNDRPGGVNNGLDFPEIDI